MWQEQITEVELKEATERASFLLFAKKNIVLSVRLLSKGRLYQVRVQGQADYWTFNINQAVQYYNGTGNIATDANPVLV